MRYQNIFEKISDNCWEIPTSFQKGMRVPARVYADESMLSDIVTDGAFRQVVNMATLPGIVNYALGMPDIHYGYGFPIGGVAAFDCGEGGVVSPGGVGYDINCGVRLLSTGLARADVLQGLSKVLHAIADLVPAGLGSGGFMTLGLRDVDRVLEKGASWVVGQGYGEASDLDNTEEGGQLLSAQSGCVSQRAKEAGRKQLVVWGLEITF